jgi:hypothetical protein
MTPGEPDAVAAYLIVMPSNAAPPTARLLNVICSWSNSRRAHVTDERIGLRGNCVGVVHRDAEAATVW